MACCCSGSCVPSSDPRAGLYPLLVARSGEGRVQVLPQGTVGRIEFSGALVRRAFVDLATTAQRTAATTLAGTDGAWTLEFAAAASAVAVVAGAQERATDRSLRECLELAGAGRRDRGEDLPALPDLGVLRLPAATRVPTLGWAERLELDFAQAWLQQPEWLLFDSVFDDPGSGPLHHLPALFHRRFPLRALSFIGQQLPVLTDAVPAPTLRF